MPSNLDTRIAKLEAKRRARIAELLTESAKLWATVFSDAELNAIVDEGNLQPGSEFTARQQELYAKWEQAGGEKLWRQLLALWSDKEKAEYFAALEVTAAKGRALAAEGKRYGQ